MQYPHGMPIAEKKGSVPGNGITKPQLSKEPLATEGEATPGPDDLRPSVPHEYEQLKEMGYYTDEDEVNTVGLERDEWQTRELVMPLGGPFNEPQSEDEKGEPLFPSPWL